MTGDKTIRVGSRKSELALIQTKHVIARLQKNFPHKKFEIHTMSTIGDRVLYISLPKIGEKSLFTRDLEEALRNGGVDFVVHSLKDLPTALPAGMAIGAVLKRDDARDALVLRKELRGHTISTLPKDSVIGTSSLRRTAQIRRLYPHLNVCDIRGNLNTRLAKLDAEDSKFAGIVLAQAGLVRMGWMQRINQILEPIDLLYAVGQGALAVECRANDHEVLDMLRSLMCLPTTCRILAERSFLKTLGGGCSAPVAVCSALSGTDVSDSAADGNRLSLMGAVWSLDGKTEIRDEICDELILAGEVSTPRKTKAKTDEVDEPNFQTKRARISPQSSDEENGQKSQSSPTVIDEDADIEKLAQSYDMQELMKKHIDLAKKCPIVGTVDCLNNAPLNGGKHDVKASGDPPLGLTKPDVHCPLSIDVGQDFMGECPFVDQKAKVEAAAAGNCPITSTTVSNSSENKNEAPVQPKCPYTAAMKVQNNALQGDTDNNTTANAHAKCPFLQKTTVQMFDYADEDKPQPSNRNCPSILTESECDTLEANLFCGLYAHACYSHELFSRSHDLGQKLAEQLIKQGALEVMKVAQTEIHSSVQ